MSVYLDNAATTPVCPQAAQAALEVMTEGYGNPSSGYAAGQAAAARLQADREAVAQALGCRPEELFFTSCGTEGDNWAILGAARAGKRLGRHIITTAVEHSAVLEPVEALEGEGWTVTRLKPDKTGHISPEDFAAALRSDTALVSMMLVNNETGAVLPVAQCARLAKAHNPQLLFHTDAVQAFLKLPFTPEELGVDLLTVSGHKIRAPKGIGALWIRSGVKLPPLLLGGGQEQGARPGTEPTAQIAALAAAVRAWTPEDRARLAAVKAYALERLAAVPGVEIPCPGDAPHICAVSLPGYPAEMLVRDLSDRGIWVSSGSACHRGKPSRVFAALGLPKRTLMGMLRISFSPATARADIDALTGALTAVLRERIPMR